VEEAIERVAAAVESSAGERRVGGAGTAGSPPPGGRDGGADDHEMVAVANLHGGSTRLLARRQILYVQSYGDFVRIVTEDGRYLIRATLGDVERRWEEFGFVRVHRQYVANLTRAVELRPLLGGTAELAFADGQTIPIARRHVAELGRRLGV
jgi:DNA-binding LytR/AlgR family response regulator